MPYPPLRHRRGRKWVIKAIRFLYCHTMHSAKWEPKECFIFSVSFLLHDLMFQNIVLRTFNASVNSTIKLVKKTRWNSTRRRLLLVFIVLSFHSFTWYSSTLTQSCSVYIYTYSHEHNSITISSDIQYTTACFGPVCRPSSGCPRLSKELIKWLYTIRIQETIARLDKELFTNWN